MFDFPPITPWIYAWLGAAALLGLIVGWLLGRVGKGRFKRERNGLRSELDEALEARRSSEEAVAETGALSADLQQRLDEAKTSLSDADREIERLRSDVENAETRATQLETEAFSSTQGTAQEADRLATQLASAHEETDSLRAALSAATVDTDARVAAAESEAQEALSRAAAVEEALSAAKLERESLQQQLETAGSSSSSDLPGELSADLREELAGARADVRDGEARLAEAEAFLEENAARLDEAHAELEAARSAADAEGSTGEALAARDHVISELQARVAGLTDIEDRFMAREAELGELQRSQAAILAAKDSEARSLRERFEALELMHAEESADDDTAEMAAALQSAQDELAITREHALHWEQEAATLRDGFATTEAAPKAGPEPTPQPTAAPASVEQRLDRMQEVLSDKEARIAYLADRIARLESNLGAIRPPAPVETPTVPVSAEAKAPAPEAAPEPSEPDDLTAIWGIGPAIQRKLNSVGITTYEHIAVVGLADRARLGDILGDFLDRFEADDWVGQARQLIEERGGVIPDARLEPIRLTPPPAAVVPDDLTAIKGIGPFIQTTLNGLGVNTYAQMAAWTEQDVEEFGESLVIFQGRITREEWVDQARRLLRRR